MHEDSRAMEHDAGSGRAMLAKSRAANVAAKQQSGMRTESARRSAADEAMSEIQALTS